MAHGRVEPTESHSKSPGAFQRDLSPGVCPSRAWIKRRAFWVLTRSLEFETGFEDFPKAKDAQSRIYFSSQPMGWDLAGVELMSNEAVITVGNDPLKAVANALDSAVQAVKGGVEDVRVSASGALPALNSFLSGVTFKT